MELIIVIQIVIIILLFLELQRTRTHLNMVGSNQYTLYKFLVGKLGQPENLNTTKDESNEDASV